MSAPRGRHPPRDVSLDPFGATVCMTPWVRPSSPMRLDGRRDGTDATAAPLRARGRTRGPPRHHHQRGYAGRLVRGVRPRAITHGGLWLARQCPRRCGSRGLQRIGFEIVAQVIWDKGLFAMGRSWYHWAHEPCWVVRRKGAKVPFLGSRDQATVWRVPSPKMIMGGSREPKQDHPAQKPALLAEIPIRNHTKLGEAVYDPFLGSGTTLIAAERHARVCYGMEIDPVFCDVILARWERFSGKTAGLAA